MPYNPNGNGPTVFIATSGYGSRTNPFTGSNSEFHPGQDYAAPLGTPIPAASTGTVWYTGYNTGGYGNTVVIRSVGADGTPYFTLYAHEDGNNMPTLGATVAEGQIIGEVGDTGRSTGAHLHFEVLNGDAPIAHSGTGGPLGVTSSDTTVRTDPNQFNDWNSAQPFGGATPLPTGSGGRGGPDDAGSVGGLVAEYNYLTSGGGDTYVTLDASGIVNVYTGAKVLTITGVTDVSGFDPNGNLNVTLAIGSGNAIVAFSPITGTVVDSTAISATINVSIRRRPPASYPRFISGFSLWIEMSSRRHSMPSSEKAMTPSSPGP